ncbi:RNA-binding protein PNO1 [Platysternon megacephalum]|uniref:RNA-binding protein PNO1 n=1 Tax=Platysternon megacephalum TaxID=55544 RepID=A0A4D9E8T1_9SAUR|nr:RNA-binding protein PNO1 [Platysternon megacephalum]
MSYPCDPPPYSNKNPLLLLQPEDYSQLGPSAVGYPQPRGDPQSGGDPGASMQPAACAGGYLVPGGYAPSVGYPQPRGPEPPRPVLPMHLGNTGLPTGNSYIVTSLGDDIVRTIDWDDKRVRQTFIRKVYTIISIQLLVTVGIIAVFTFVSPVRNFVQGNVTVYYSSYAVFLVTYLLLACCQGPRRRFPWNLILLSIFTLAMAFMAGTIASMYDTTAVLIAMVITAKVAIIVTVFCFQTKVDFTSCTGLFCVLGMVVLLTSIVTAIVLYYKYVSSGCSL